MCYLIPLSIVILAALSLLAQIKGERAALKVLVSTKLFRIKSSKVKNQYV